MQLNFMLNCPHCYKPTFSSLRKLFLGPAWFITCKKCGKKVGVAWISMLGLLPLFVGMWFDRRYGVPTTMPVGDISLSLLLFHIKGTLIGGLLLLLWHARVPLERRLPTQRMQLNFMLNCPHCYKPTISSLRKFFLGPAWSITCKECGKKVGVPWISMLGLLPLFVGSWFDRHPGGHPTIPVGDISLLFHIKWTLVGGLLLLLWHARVPLERR